MGFSDRLRAWFKGETKRSAPSPSTDKASRATTKELESFIGSRAGVEAYLEPKTAIYSTTLLLVADDGEYLRRPVKDRNAAVDLCGRANVPLYDARKVGYPRRMKEYDRGVRPNRVSLDDLPPWPGDDAPAAPGDVPARPETPTSGPETLPPPPEDGLRDDGPGRPGEGPERPDDRPGPSGPPPPPPAAG
jgi:hypothetical protein